MPIDNKKTNGKKPVNDKSNTKNISTESTTTVPKKTETKKLSLKTTIAKKAEAKKTETKKIEKQKPEPKKSVAKKAEPKKPQPKKPENKKTEKKANDKFSLKSIGGLLFAKMFKGGATELRANAEEVNKLNVFPVPDGDTGDNMSMTIDSGVAAIEDNDSDNLAEVMNVFSRGMLLGARGNSGVILSQFFAGMATGFAKSPKADAKVLGKALQRGVKQAYAAVMTPTEGTILTVIREAVNYAVNRITEKSTINSLFQDLVTEMHASLDRTPDLLPQLKEAGVVDSGGAGLFYIMDGINRVLNGEEIPDIAPNFSEPEKPKCASTGSFNADSEMTFGYCTELLCQLQNKKCNPDEFDVEELKAFLAELGDSIVAFKTESIVKVHVHTLTPELVLGHMRKYGEFLTVKIENMSLQHTELEAEKNNDTKKSEEKPKERKKYGVVATSNGPGITNLFREFGADEIVLGGQTKNPSTHDFLEAFENINAEHIFVFPNNGNIVMAAGQAAEIYKDAKIHVIPTKSAGAGYVALTCMNFENENAEDIVNEANEAIGRITSAFLSPAVRDADMNGVHVNEGDFIGIIAKDIVVSEPSLLDAAHKLIDKLISDGAFMLTVFVGQDAKPEEKSDIEEYINKNYADIECYFIDGGQEIYPFSIVAE